MILSSRGTCHSPSFSSPSAEHGPLIYLPSFLHLPLNPYAYTSSRLWHLPRNGMSSKICSWLISSGMHHGSYIFLLLVSYSRAFVELWVNNVEKIQWLKWSVFCLFQKLHVPGRACWAFQHRIIMMYHSSLHRSKFLFDHAVSHWFLDLLIQDYEHCLFRVCKGRSIVACYWSPRYWRKQYYSRLFKSHNLSTLLNVALRTCGPVSNKAHRRVLLLR